MADQQNTTTTRREGGVQDVTLERELRGDADLPDSLRHVDAGPAPGLGLEEAFKQNIHMGSDRVRDLEPGEAAGAHEGAAGRVAPAPDAGSWAPADGIAADGFAPVGTHAGVTAEARLAGQPARSFAPGAARKLGGWYPSKATSAYAKS